MNSAKTSDIGQRDYLNAPANKELNHIPGSYGWPLIGHSLHPIFYGLLDFLLDQYKKYGTVSRTMMGGQRQLIVLGPELNQQILLDKKREFSNQMGYHYNMAPFFGGGLMLRDFDEHRMHRRIMQTAFKTDTLRSYIDIINPALATGIADWDKISNFHFFPEIKQVLLRVAADIFIGVKNPGRELDQMNEAFLHTVEGLRHLFRVRLPGFKYHQALKGRDYLHSVFRQMLPEKRRGKGDDMFTHFAQETDSEGELFSDDDVIQHIHFLMMAAHDTTTSALSNCLSALVSYPQWQERLREEALNFERPALNYDDLSERPLLEMFMFEVLRLHGPVPMSMRRTTCEVQLGDYRVPAHTVLGITPTFTHYMEEWWDQPYHFDPLRFSPERSEQKRHSFSYIPFGGGAHKCIGMHFAMLQIKCFLHQFLRTYEAQLPAGYKMPIAFQDVPFPHPKDKLPLILKKIA